MIYVVTGTQRSGTSMMMGALMAGGMEAYYNQDKERELREGHPDTNVGGYFEPALEEMAQLEFPLPAEGKAVKFHAPWKLLGFMAPAKYKIILIKRDPREIVLSLAKFNKGMVTTGDLAVFTNYEKYIQRGIELAENRRDVESLTIVDYDTLLSDPKAFFDSLDWPIDSEKAASFINPEQRKVKKFDTPYSGDLMKELNFNPPQTVREMIVEGKIQVPDEVKKKAEQGVEFGFESR